PSVKFFYTPGMSSTLLIKGLDQCVPKVSVVETFIKSDLHCGTHMYPGVRPFSQVDSDFVPFLRGCFVSRKSSCQMLRMTSCAYGRVVTFNIVR
ncbi:hypothetical protein JI435_413300, partial [Parastagonospora nodorum SN15]